MTDGVSAGEISGQKGGQSENEQSGRESSHDIESLVDDEYLQALRQQMLKFAILQLGNEHAAEDAVQEALLGAMKNAESFKARAALKTWVFAILKNKIADALRKKSRSKEVTNLMGSDDDESVPDVFTQNGSWKPGEGPANWGDPELAFKQGQFWVVFETCLDELPEGQARVFMMREFIGLESNEICEQLDLSTSNLHVLLHRARLRLRECLENCWFEGGKTNV